MCMLFFQRHGKLCGRSSLTPSEGLQLPLVSAGVPEGDKTGSRAGLHTEGGSVPLHMEVAGTSLPTGGTREAGLHHTAGTGGRIRKRQDSGSSRVHYRTWTQSDIGGQLQRRRFRSRCIYPVIFIMFIFLVF